MGEFLNYTGKIILRRKEIFIRHIRRTFGFRKESDFIVNLGTSRPIAAWLVIIALGLMMVAGCSDDPPLAPDCPDCPDCPDNPDIIAGSVTVSTATELAALEGVGTILGHLRIDGSSTPDSIRTLAPLASLRWVERLTISRTAMTDLRGLDSLRTVFTYLTIERNDSLVTLAGLDSLSFATSLSLRYLPQLTSIAALHGLGGLDYMGLEDMDLLESIDVFDDLSTLSQIRIYSSPSLTELPISTPLPSLESVRLHTLQSLDNVMLGSEPPENLTYLYLVNLASMVRPIGLARLSGLERLSLGRLPELVDLGNPGAMNNLREVWISDTPKLSTLGGFASLPVLTNLGLVGPSSLTALTGLPQLNMLRDLTLRGHENLETLDGLSSAPALRDLDFEDLAVLADLEGLPAMPGLQTMSLTTLPALSSLGTGHTLSTLWSLALDDVGIIDLKTLDEAPLLERLNISYCLNLQTLEGTENLPSFRDIHLNNCPAFYSFGTGATRDNLLWVTVRECDALVDMHGFGPSPEMTSIYIDRCDGLLSLEGLHLRSTMQLLSVYGCDQLQTLEGLGDVETIGDRLKVALNPALTSLDGLSGLSSAEEIYVVGNINLGNTTVFDFVNALEYWGSLEVGGNEPGDKSVVTLWP